jgi:hypothetical protein
MICCKKNRLEKYKDLSYGSLQISSYKKVMRNKYEKQITYLQELKQIAVDVFKKTPWYFL